MTEGYIFPKKYLESSYISEIYFTFETPPPKAFEPTSTYTFSNITANYDNNLITDIETAMGGSSQLRNNLPRSSAAEAA
jgi:hypothetical protein